MITSMISYRCVYLRTPHSASKVSSRNETSFSLSSHGLSDIWHVRFCHIYMATFWSHIANILPCKRQAPDIDIASSLHAILSAILRVGVFTCMTGAHWFCPQNKSRLSICRQLLSPASSCQFEIHSRNTRMTGLNVAATNGDERHEMYYQEGRM